MRKLCIKCGIKPQAINYKKEDRIYYRSLCDSCLVIQIKKKKPRWQKEGYNKLFKCEACEFVPKFSEQLTVHDDGTSFKTVCLNCDKEETLKAKMESKKLILKPDF
jgi:hypothetical protein